MTWTIERSNASEFDIEEIWLTIAPDNPAVADSVIDAITSVILRLSDFPYLGRRRDDIAPGLRGRVHGSYLVLYELDEQFRRILVKRIIHGRRDLATAFRKPGE